MQTRAGASQQKTKVNSFFEPARERTDVQEKCRDANMGVSVIQSEGREQKKII